jgi:hypothetical protein
LGSLDNRRVEIQGIGIIVIQALCGHSFSLLIWLTDLVTCDNIYQVLSVLKD